jgi:hypothetical protein
MAESDEHGPLGKEHVKTAKAGLLLRLGEAPYGREAGRVGLSNLLARSGMPVAEGVVLTHDFHRRFIESGGLARHPRLCERRRRRPTTGARPTARVRSGPPRGRFEPHDLRRAHRAERPHGRGYLRGRKPGRSSQHPRGVLAAGLEVWLSMEGLKRQMEAAVRGEKPPRGRCLFSGRSTPDKPGVRYPIQDRRRRWRRSGGTN